MSTLAVANALASVFVPIGMTGAAIALACALVAGFALARGAAGLAGGAIGVWIVGAMLSLASSFADVWMPSVISLAALGAAFTIGAVARVLARLLGPGRDHARGRAGMTTEGTAPVGGSRVPPSPATAARPRAGAPARASGPMTDGMRAVA